MKKITVLIAALLSCACAFAFDWKPQTNEQLRNDMFRFVEEFRNSTPDKALTKELDAFLKTQKAQAGTRPYAWIQDTHDFVDRMLDKFPAELSDGGRCSSERRNLLLLRDYPMHADNKPKDAPEQLKEAYVNSVKGLYAAAESDALRWLSKGRKSKKLEMFKTYNMGFLFRSAGKVVAVDVQWSGSDAQMDEFASMVDVFFVTHPHGDHYDKPVLEAMIRAGKPVVMPVDLLPEIQSPLKIVVATDCPEGVEVGGIRFESRMGNQGVKIPCNVYLLSIGGWNIAHNGDNSVDQAEEYLSARRVDVLVAACWNKFKDTMDHIKANPEGTRCIYMTSHENEWGHTVDHRESYEELFRRSDRLGDAEYQYLPTVVLDAAGDGFVLK